MQPAASSQPTGQQPADGGATGARPQAAVSDPALETGGAGESDWLDRICPYLISADGTHRSSQPDPGHRCTAQSPASTLPTAFQERYCLTDRHVRCEMYKVAEGSRAAALGQQGIPADQVRSARFRPSVRSVPLALGPSSASTAGTGQDSRRPALLAVGVLAVLIVAVVLLVMALGGGGVGPVASPSPSVVATATPTPTPTPTPRRSTNPPASSAAAVGERLFEYTVQEGEDLQSIAQTLGLARAEIMLLNEGMVDRKPKTTPGDVIILPGSTLLAAEQVEALVGFDGWVEE